MTESCKGEKDELWCESVELVAEIINKSPVLDHLVAGDSLALCALSFEGGLDLVLLLDMALMLKPMTDETFHVRSYEEGNCLMSKGIRNLLFVPRDVVGFARREGIVFVLNLACGTGNEAVAFPVIEAVGVDDEACVAPLRKAVMKDHIEFIHHALQRFPGMVDHPTQALFHVAVMDGSFPMMKAFVDEFGFSTTLRCGGMTPEDCLIQREHRLWGETQWSKHRIAEAQRLTALIDSLPFVHHSKRTRLRTTIS